LLIPMVTGLGDFWSFLGDFFTWTSFINYRSSPH
jgi:hypothetical protein